MTQQSDGLSRVEKSLVERIADRNEALAGDLAEGYRVTHSRLWLWRQFVGAVLSGAFRRPDEVRPLKIVEQPTKRSPRPDLVPGELHPRTLGLAVLTASPVAGIGGLGIVAVVVLITIVQPALWVIPVFGLLGGAVLGLILVKRARQHRMLSLR